MEDRDTARRSAHAHAACRIVDAVADVAVLQVIHEFLGCHHRAIVLGLRRGSSKVRRRDTSSHSGYSRIGEVGNIPADPAGSDLLNDGFLVNQDIPRHIDEDHAFLHLLNSFSADHTLCGRKCGHVDRDEVASVVNLIKVKNVCDLPVQMPRRVYRHIRIIAIYFHTEFYRHIGHAHADRAESDDAESLSGELGSGEFLLFLLGGLRDIRIIPVGADPVDAFNDITGCQQHSCQNHLLYAVGICAGSVEDHNSFSGAALQRNIIDSRACSCDRQKLRRKLHIMHSRASNQYSLGLGNLFRFLEIRREHLQSFVRNVVETCVFEHRFVLSMTIPLCHMPTTSYFTTLFRTAQYPNLFTEISLVFLAAGNIMEMLPGIRILL